MCGWARSQQAKASSIAVARWAMPGGGEYAARTLATHAPPSTSSTRIDTQVPAMV